MKKNRFSFVPVFRMNLTILLPVLLLTLLVAGLPCRSEDVNAAGTAPPSVRVIAADWQNVKGPPFRGNPALARERRSAADADAAMMLS